MLNFSRSWWAGALLAAALLAQPGSALAKDKPKSEPASPPAKTKEVDAKAKSKEPVPKKPSKLLLQRSNPIGEGRPASPAKETPKPETGPGRSLQGSKPTGPGRDTSIDKNVKPETDQAKVQRPQSPDKVGPGRQSPGSTGPARDTGPDKTTGNKEFSGKPVGPARGSDQGDTVKTGASRRDPEPAKLPAATDDPDDKPAKRKPAQDAVDPSKAAARTAKPDDTPAPKQARDSEPKAAASPAPATTRTLAAPAGAAGAAAVAAVAAVAATGTLAANAPAYSHNNSTMKLVPEGDAVRLVYDKPKPGLEGLGIKAGTPLFEGKKTGDSTYAGNATTFSRACGTATFPVAGEASGGTVTLRGQKPVRDPDCKVTGYTSETLVFEAK
jgi:hypothetical protein